MGQGPVTQPEGMTAMDHDRTPPLTRMNPPAMPDAGAFGYSQITVAEPGQARVSAL